MELCAEDGGGFKAPPMVRCNLSAVLRHWAHTLLPTMYEIRLIANMPKHWLHQVSEQVTI